MSGYAAGVTRERSPAIVLRRWPYSETSLTLRALTPGRGTIGLLAKGVNRIGSGSFAVLDTWALVEIEYGGSEEAELLSLYGAKLLDRRGGLESDPERLAAAAVLAEIAEDAAPPGLPAPEVFAWLSDVLGDLAGLPAGADPAPLLAAALMRGLRLHGLEPALDAPRDRAPGERAWLSPAEGGLVLAPARPHEHARPLAPPVLAALRRLGAATRGDGVARPGGPAADSEPWDEILTILVEFLHYHAERAPRAWPLLQERRRRRRRRRRTA